MLDTVTTNSNGNPEIGRPKRGRGRPPRPDGVDPVFLFRVPRPLRAAALEAAVRRGVTPSEIARAALAAYLASLANSEATT